MELEGGKTQLPSRPNVPMDFSNREIKELLHAFLAVVPIGQPETSLQRRVDEVVSNSGPLRGFRDSLRALGPYLESFSDSDQVIEESEADTESTELCPVYTNRVDDVEVPKVVCDRILKDPSNANELLAELRLGRDFDLIVFKDDRIVIINGWKAPLPEPLILDTLIALLQGRGRPTMEDMLSFLDEMGREMDSDNLPRYKYEAKEYLQRFIPECSIKPEHGHYVLRDVQFLLIG